MTQMVTRCPTCATAFRITSTQLESAKGAVRCGSCLHIFKAQDYLVKAGSEATTAEKPVSTQVAKPTPKAAQPKTEQPPLTSATVKSSSAAPKSAVATQPKSATAKLTSEQTAPAKPIIDKAKVLEDEEDVLISDNMDQETEKGSIYEFDGFVDLDMRPKQTVSLFEREIRYELPKDEQEEVQDESWAEELLDEPDENLPQIKRTAPPAKTNPTPKATATEAETQSPSEPAQADTTKNYSGPVFSLVGEAPATSDEESAPLFSQEFLSATNSAQAKEEKAAEAAFFASELFNSSAADTDYADAEPEQEKPSSKRPVKSSKMRAFDTSRAALLMNIMPAPLEFTGKRMRRWYQRKLWSSLSLLMALILFFQVAYFKFDYFSRVEPYRTAYLFVCPILGCQVPTLIDTSKILATNLIVRNHTKVANALIVDAILINTAPFEQPFPDLILSFSKLDETPVATRRFSPNEYLAGELAGAKHIPVRQQVHIALEIADPGPEAVNYTLATH